MGMVARIEVAVRTRSEVLPIPRTLFQTDADGEDGAPCTIVLLTLYAAAKVVGTLALVPLAASAAELTLEVKLASAVEATPSCSLYFWIGLRLFAMALESAVRMSLLRLQ